MPININGYSRINRNGSININTDPMFGVLPTNLQVSSDNNPSNALYISSVSIGGGPAYIIKTGTFPVYGNDAAGNTFLYGHHFGGTSITIYEYTGTATIQLYINGVEIAADINVFIDPHIYTYTFTETDIIQISFTSIIY